MNEAWRVLREVTLDPRLNLSLEEAIMASNSSGLSPNTLRFWRNRGSVILGRAQNVDEEADLEACEELDVAVVRRFTGGGSVFTDVGCLNWTFVARREDLRFSLAKGVTYPFSLFAKVVSKGLDKVGVRALYHPPNTLVSAQRKISGMAAYISSRTILCHGTLLIDSKLDILRKVLKKLKMDVINIRDLKKEPLLLEETKEAIIRSLEETLNVETTVEEVDDSESSLAKKLLDLKYLKKEWNLEGKSSPEVREAIKIRELSRIRR